jgi:DNA-binding LacI/PurR family transcriptional regulator
MSGVFTMKELALQLNVSVSTVSRALRNHSKVSLKIRLEAQRLARDLNYEPDLKAISLRKRKSFIIGVILPSVSKDFFSKSLNSIEDVAIRNGYMMLLGQSWEDVKREQSIIKEMVKQRVDGLLIASSQESNGDDHFLILEKYRIPVVYFDRELPMNNVNKVFCRLDKGTEQIVDALLKFGKRRIALINGPNEMAGSQDRLIGYKNAISKKLKIDMQMVETTDLSEKGTGIAMTRLLNLKRPPDAIISFDDYVHLDAVKYASQKGINVNKDIIFASYGNIAANQHVTFPPAISLDQFPSLQGTVAMNLLLEVISNKELDNSLAKPFTHREIRGKLVFNNELKYGFTKED